jgi:hypothetical protein
MQKHGERSFIIELPARTGFDRIDQRCRSGEVVGASAGSRDGGCLAGVFGRARGEVFFCFLAILVL